jgi:hypothetical protein
MATIDQVIEAVHTVKHFVGDSQLEAMGNGVRGEEAEFFKTLFVKLADQLQNMPKVYEQDGKGDEAVVYLHYFLGNMDWYITERDLEIDEQIQAFGLADLGMGYPELGYISIEEITNAGAELDLYWTPKTLAEVKS